MTSSLQLTGTYFEHVDRFERELDTDAALQMAVGGEFDAIGRLEYHLLRSRGLRDGHLVVDVGCGSGRLACQLAPLDRIRYIGCDVVPRLLDYAADRCSRRDWRFLRTTGTVIPCEDNAADYVCFFSVFTHLHQEDIFRYLREAQRVLKPGGLVLMSFLEFGVKSHWDTFIASVDGTRNEDHLNQFVERAAIKVWSEEAGFKLLGMHAGDTAYIPLPEEIRFEDGTRMSNAGSLGQSLAVLQKRIPVSAADSSERVPARAAEIPAPCSQPYASPAGDARSSVSNVSARVRVPAAAAAILGFSVEGSEQRQVLIRAVGPGLSIFGVPNPLLEPVVRIHSGDRLVAEAALSWSGAPAVAAAAHAAGAFPLAPEGRDVAFLVSVEPGNHTVVVTSATPAAGEVLIEVYFI